MKFKKFATQKLVAAVLAGSLGLYGVLNGNVVKAADAGLARYAVKQAEITEFVDSASENSNRAIIKEFHDYCEDVYALSNALKKGGKLYGLIEDFDRIALIGDSGQNPYFMLSAIKDGEITSYAFQTSLELNSRPKVVHTLKRGILSKNNLKLLYKTTDNDRALVKTALPYLYEKISSDSSIQKFIDQGYQVIVTPSQLLPMVAIESAGPSNQYSSVSVSIAANNLYAEKNVKTGQYSFLVYSQFRVALVKPSTGDIKNYDSYVFFKANETANLRSLVDLSARVDNFMNQYGLEYYSAYNSNGSMIYSLANNDYSDLLLKLGFNVNDLKFSRIDLINNENMTSNEVYFDYSLGSLDGLVIDFDSLAK